MNKKTKQGVRDLNYLKGKSGKRLELPESMLEEELASCQHKRTRESGDGFSTICNSCGRIWNCDGVLI